MVPALKMFTFGVGGRDGEESKQSIVGPHFADEGPSSRDSAPREMWRHWAKEDFLSEVMLQVSLQSWTDQYWPAISRAGEKSKEMWFQAENGTDIKAPRRLFESKAGAEQGWERYGGFGEQLEGRAGPGWCAGSHGRTHAKTRKTGTAVGADPWKITRFLE